MNPNELLLTALALRFEKYISQRKHCKTQFSEEAVHDLRVATRRQLAMVEVLRTIEPTPRLKKLRKDFKDQLDSLDTLRDTQVMLVEISESLDNLPELIPLQKFLQKREKRLLRSAEKDVLGFRTRDTSRRIEKISSDLATSDDNSITLTSLLSALDDAYSTATQRMGHVDPVNPATIHHVRIAFKKFRYMLEILYPLIPDIPATQVKAMHDYQAKMGGVQDVEVLLATLTEFLDKHPSYDPKPVREYYEQRHKELINAYVEDMNELFTFWRETPEKPFSWEK